MNLSFPQTDKPHYFPELEFWIFEILKGSNFCPIRAWSVSDGPNCAPFCYLSLQNRFRLLFDMIWSLWNITNSRFKLRKIMRFVCLRKWQMHQHLLNKSHLSDCNFLRILWRKILRIDNLVIHLSKKGKLMLLSTFTE